MGSTACGNAWSGTALDLAAPDIRERWPAVSSRAGPRHRSRKGRNALYLAERGFEVVAVDISKVALNVARQHAEQQHLHVVFQQLDLEQSFPEGEYDLIRNINYLQRSLIPKIKAALRVGGHVILETYSIDQQVIGHPKNPNYLLAHNELLDHFRDFRVFYYREGKFSDGGDPSFRAGIFAQRI